MTDGKWIPRDERVDEMVRLGVEISRLEEDLHYAENQRVEGLIRAELSRNRVELYRLRAMPDEPPAPVQPRRRKNPRAFYYWAFAILAVFLVSGAVLWAFLTVLAIIGNYFTTPPPDADKEPVSREVVKE